MGVPFLPHLGPTLVTENSLFVRVTFLTVQAFAHSSLLVGQGYKLSGRGRIVLYFQDF